MKTALNIIFFIIGLILGGLIDLAYAADSVLPNSSLTPGALSSVVVRDIPLSTICTKGYASGYFSADNAWHHAESGKKRPPGAVPVRNLSEAEKLATYKAYGMKGDDRSACKEGYEIDHLCSLELGCNNVAENRWPQSYCGTWNAHMKDKLEGRLHSLVCAGKITLKQAQTCISTDWVACYKDTFK